MAKVLIAHGSTPRLKRAVQDLQAAGLDVVATPDGGDAFARFFEESPELVVCSASLPGLSGINFARMVRSQSPDTPVIVLVEGDTTLDSDITSLPDPLDVGALLSLFPAIAAAAQAKTGVPNQPLVPSSAAEVFTLAALKRFQRGSNILALLDDAGIAQMARIARHHARGDGEPIIQQGEISDGFYLVVEGQVRVTLAEKENAEIARIGEGGFFGEMALLSDQPRSASVWAVGNTTLLYFDRQEFAPLLEMFPTMREVLGGVALKRTEENLWRVLFADDEVQRSLGELKDRPEVPEAIPEVELPDAFPPPSELAPEATPTDDTAIEMPPTAPVPAPFRPDSAPEVEPRRPATPLTRSIWRSFAMGSVAGIVIGATAAWTTWMLVPDPSEELSPAAQDEAPPSEPHDESAAAAPSAAKVAVPSEKIAQEAATPSRTGLNRKDLRKALFATFKAKEFAKAAALGAELRDLHGLDWESELALADAQRESGLVDDAFATYKHFAEEYPTNVRADDALFYMAEILLARGKRREARELYEEITADPKSNFRESATKRLEERR